MHFLCYNWLNLDGHVHPYPLGRPCSQNITDKAPVVSKHAHPEGNRAGWLSAQHHILCSPQGFSIHLVLHTYPIAARMESVILLVKTSCSKQGCLPHARSSHRNSYMQTTSPRSSIQTDKIHSNRADMQTAFQVTCNSTGKQAAKHLVPA